MPLQQPDFRSATLVSAYGAVGDGTTDDTLAVRAAIAAAGVNGKIVFPPNSTLLLTGSVNPLQGQTWFGYGATLKRAAEVSTTTATAITTGQASQTLTLASVAGLAVGMDVSVYSGATADTMSHRITALDGAAKTITIDTAFTVAFPSGGNVIRSFAQIDTTRTSANVTDLTILGLSFNGNSANNSSLRYWWLNSEILAAGDRLRIRDCYIINAQAEGILCAGTDILVESNHIQDCQGNGIHFGALPSTNQGKFLNNFVKNTNLAGVGALPTHPGHEDGCIVLSSLCSQSLVDGNYCENGIAGVASINASDNSDITVTNNTVYNCTSYAIGGLCSSDYVQNLVISGNRCYSSGYIYLYSGGSPGVGVGPRRFVVSNNVLVGTWIRMFGCYDGTVVNNAIYNASDTTNNAILADSCRGIVIGQNSVTGGARNIHVIGGANSKEVLVTGNRCLNGTLGGIALYDDGMIDCSAANNTVTVDSAFAADTAYAAMRGGNGALINGNVIDIGTNVSGQSGILCPNGATGTLGALAQNNVIRTKSSVPSIKLFGSSQNNIVMNNFIVQAISQGGAGVQPNTVSGNTTIF
jgi:hypothetical protein